ncbi:MULTISPECIES: FAD-dependent oxidoreductase [Streptomyces]|uniref:FAD-dependent oxidoreductase n=1 Tax=Streptomyces TaxID=1883 RepID=UPI0006FE4DAB|nr:MULTISPECIES: FAD-dependent oxidoreductase [Streptomyces]KQX94657.1 NADP oxidoreductase [Streptomyces sp. Root1319]KQZ05382.1 NADP oxidoreductase [Streptomyces sp. Root55]RPK72817.1 NADPH-ferredoxin reductase FprA [Streptomyces sp. ADI97-07]WRY80617.1 FAD-dependent oxidoreductase [Streptomyces clavifer]WUC26396.1 FAD-dependent oxidoreductase [Streptomyces clavifer]
MLRVAVVGSGPSGVYTAQALLQQSRVPDVRVHVLDRLPTPYGLVRYGVAPDHEKIKSLQSSLRAVLEDERITFVGHVEVGGPGGLSPARLKELYHAVVYCVGAAADRPLSVPGEDLPGSFSATEFVSWYSAHPDAAADGFALHAGSAVVVGVGNVAVDVARILARGAAELRATDVPRAALDALGSSRVRDVHIAGRRGPSQARFTTKELRELGALPGVRMVVDGTELALDPAYAAPAGGPGTPPLPAVVRRNLEVLRGWSQNPPPAPHGLERRIRMRFFLRPVELLERGGRVAGVRFARTAPDGAGGVRDTGAYEDVEAQLVLRAVGYRGTPLPGLPFDPAHGTVPHLAGRVLRDGVASPGEYVAGWIKRGPTGVIGSNRSCAKETVASLVEDAPLLVRGDVTADPLEALRASGQLPVEWDGWLSIERAEAELGRSLGRGRVKIPDWSGLLDAARGEGR